MAHTTKIFGRMGMFMESFEENARRIATFDYSHKSIPKIFTNVFQHAVSLPLDLRDIVFSTDVFIGTVYWEEWIEAYEKLISSLCLVDAQLVMHSIFEDALVMYSYVFESAAPGMDNYSFKRDIYEIDLNSSAASPRHCSS